MGSVLSPFNAFLLLQGIETVALRIERHVENARKVAELPAQAIRASPGSIMPASPTAPITRWCRNIWMVNASSLFTFGIKGGLEAGKTFYDALKLITRLVNIGDAKSLACHPGIDHPPPDVCRSSSAWPACCRKPSGFRSASNTIADIIEDIDQALAQACSRHQRLEAAE